MLSRKIFSELEEHLKQRYITVITGMRRVGKSTALKYLLDKVPHDNKLYLDLERIENRYIFQQNTYKDVQIELEIQGIDFEKPSVIALDEIQLVPQITSILKYFYDTYPVKFIVTGSSSFYLRNHFSESLAGRKHIFEMFPLDFMEFVQFRGTDSSVLERFAFQPYQQGIYLKYKDLYEEYLRFGGFPEVVLANNVKEKEMTLKDVVNAYIELDIRLVADFEVSGTLYKLIRLLAARAGNTLDVSKIAAVLGMDRIKTAGYLDLLEKTYFIHTIFPLLPQRRSGNFQTKKNLLSRHGPPTAIGAGQQWHRYLKTRCICNLRG
jgi:predicted AAA+ superfamily ATPase